MEQGFSSSCNEQLVINFTSRLRCLQHVYVCKFQDVWVFVYIKQEGVFYFSRNIDFHFKI